MTQTKARTTSAPGRRGQDPTLRLLRPVLPSLAAGVALQAAGSLFSAASFIALARLVSRLIEAGAGADGAPGSQTGLFDAAIASPLFWFLTTLGLSAAFSAAALLVTHFADVRLQADLRYRMAAKLARLPLGWFDQRSSGRVRQLVQNDVDSLHQLVAHTVVEMCAGVLTPLAGLIVSFYLDWRLGLVAVVPLVLYGVAFSALAPGDNRRVMEEIHEGLAQVSDAIVEYVNGVAVLKVFGRASSGFARFSGRSEEFLDSFRRLVGPQMRAQSIAVVFFSAAVVGALEVAFGLWFLRAGWTTPANLLVVTVIAMLIPAALQTVAVSNQARSRAVDAARRVIALVDSPELELPAAGEQRSPRGSAIDIDSVSFSYGAGARALDDVTVQIPEGTVTALVGPSGSGKSTLAALIARHRDCDEGSVSIGGADVRSMDPEVLRRTVGTVFQDAQLLNLSVAGNIALGADGVSRDQVRRAARAANIDARIGALPRGYDSVIGEDARLSGGEQQRVAIARALVRDTPVLVLDEATSATDPESETAVQEGLSRLVRGRTVVVIAHRLTTIAGADQIVVMDRGKVVETGTHDDLMASAGLYRRMWEDMEQGVEKQEAGHK